MTQDPPGPGASTPAPYMTRSATKAAGPRPPEEMETGDPPYAAGDTPPALTPAAKRQCSGGPVDPSSSPSSGSPSEKQRPKATARSQAKDAGRRSALVKGLAQAEKAHEKAQRETRDTLAEILGRIDETINSGLTAPGVRVNPNARLTLFRARDGVLDMVKEYINGSLKAPAGFPAKGPLPPPGSYPTARPAADPQPAKKGGRSYAAVAAGPPKTRAPTHGTTSKRTPEGAKPQRVAWSQYADSTLANHRDVLVAFKEADLVKTPVSVVLFATTVKVRRRNPVPRVEQCQRCFGYHRTTPCQRKPRCPVCGSAKHGDDRHEEAMNDASPGGAATLCHGPPRCANCLGPHEVTTETCPARPSISGGKLVRPQPEALARIRLAGKKKSRLQNGRPGEGEEGTHPGSPSTRSTPSTPSTLGTPPAGRSQHSSVSPSL